MSKKINIRPTSSVYATYKRLSYQPWTAIAEFVDNSTQSFYDHKQDLLSQKYSEGLTITIDYIEDLVEGDRIEIVDNAFGMEWTDFQRAVVLDKPPQNTSGRNEFGMGLKTAACWFGSLWSVESTQLHSQNKYYTEINIDELGKYKTEEIDVQESMVSQKSHFTKIIIRNLNKKIKGSRTIGKVKELLSSTYREDIRSGYVKIFYNGTLLQFKEAPVYVEDLGDKKIEWKKPVTFSISHEGRALDVSGFIAIRIPGSVKDAGFTLIRRGRVIIGGSEGNYRPSELFGDSNSYAWQRLYGELHMDNWPVTQAKDNFDWHNSGLEEAFIEQLKNLTVDYRKKADSIRVREKIQTDELARTAVESLTNSGIVENVDIKVLPFISNFLVSGEEDISQYNSFPGAAGTEATNAVDTDSGCVSVEGGHCIDYRFKYKNSDYIFHTMLDLSNPSAHWLLVEPNSEFEYSLSINMRHPYFKPLIEKKEFMPLMMKMAISIVLAEIESISQSPDGRIDPSDIRLKMNEILDVVGRGDL